MAGPWDKYASAPQKGQVVSIPEAPDPDKAIRSQLLQLQLQQKMKEAQGGGDNALSPEALDAETTNWILTGKMSPMGMGASALRVQIQNNRPVLMKKYGITENELPAIQQKFKADSDAYNKRVAQGSFMQQAEEGAKGHAAQIEGYLKNLPAQGKATPLNAISSGAQRLMSGETITNLDATIPLLKSEIAKIMTANPSGSGQLTDDARHEFDTLEGNVAPERKIEALHALLQMADTKVKANNDEGSRLSQRMTGGLAAYAGGGGAPGAGMGGQPPASGGGAPGGGPPPTDPTAPATGPTRTEITRGPLDKQISAMLAGGVPSATIRKFAQDNGYTKNLDGVLAFRAMHPTYKGGYDVHEENVVPTTAYQRAMGSPVAAGVLGAVDAGTMGLTDEATGAINTLRNGGSLTDNIRSADYSKQMLANANPEASLLGNVVGGAGAMMAGGAGINALLRTGAKGGFQRNLLAWMLKNPMKSAALGDTLYGAGYGAGENNDNRVLGAAVGAPVGAVGSFLGSGLSKATASALDGVVNPAVQRLRAAGIPLTVGEVLGGGFKKAQDAMTSVFGPGNMVANRYADGRLALNKLAYNTAGQAIDTPINAVGQDGIDLLNTAKNQAYSKALDPISLNLNDPKFLNPIGGVIQGAEAIPAGELPEGFAANTIKHYVGNNLDPGGTMTGAGFQNAYRGMARVANKAAPKIEGHDVGQALGQAKDILAGTLEDQNPGAYADFLKANSANRMLNILADANKQAKNQITDGGEVLFTPAQLGTAATNNAVKYNGKVAAAAGNRPFNQLINDSQQVMSSKLGESGTIPRLIATSLATGGAGGLGYGANGGEGAAEGGIGTLGLLTALGTRQGQQLITAALMKRTIADQIAARGLRRSPTVGGDLLASLGIPLLDSPTP